MFVSIFIVSVCVILIIAASAWLLRPKGDSVPWQLSLSRSIRALGWLLLIPVWIAVQQIPSQSTVAGRSMFTKIGIISAALAVVFIIAGHLGVRRFR